MMTPDDDIKGNVGSRDVTSVYDDDNKGNLAFRDVTSACDDDARGDMGSGM